MVCAKDSLQHQWNTKLCTPLIRDYRWQHWKGKQNRFLEKDQLKKNGNGDNIFIFIKYTVFYLV
jgi:hypothetical protein